MWREAAADARQAIRADPCFVKAHLHLGKVLLQQRQLGEAREAVQRGMATLQEAGQNAACAPLQDGAAPSPVPRPQCSADPSP